MLVRGDEVGKRPELVSRVVGAGRTGDAGQPLHTHEATGSDAQGERCLAKPAVVKEILSSPPLVRCM
jgi:hypothetical protein